MNGSLQEKHGKYYAVFSYKDEDGKHKNKWVSTGISTDKGNLRKAEKRLAELIIERQDEKERNRCSKDMQFANYIDVWCEDVRKRVDVVTYTGYKSYIDNHIRPYFADKNLTLRQIDRTDVEKYLEEKATSGRLDGRPGGLSRRSLELHKSVLSKMFSDAMREPYNLKDNPCKMAMLPKNAKKTGKHITFYNVEQCKELLRVTAGTPLYDMVYITFMYGLRRSELLGLKWDAIDFEEDTLTICHTLVMAKGAVAKDSTKNQSSRRTYPILADVRPILKKLKWTQEENKRLMGNCYNDSGYVFTKKDGSPYNPGYPYQRLMKVIKRYNLPILRWHDLRHSCASFLLTMGWSMKDISEWLGHADIGTTMNIYAHLDIGYKRKLADGLTGTLN